MSRKGKRERVIEARQSIITANMMAPSEAPLKTKGVGPSGYKSQSTDAKTRLKGSNSGVGFNGPRGFVSPVYAVGRAERDGGALGPYKANAVAPKPLNGNASKRHAGDILWGAEVLGYDYSVPKPSGGKSMIRRGKAPWRTLGA